MDSGSRSGPDDPTARTLDAELELVRSAIALVAAGGAPRVTVGNLHFGELLVEPARELALAAGVRVVPLWNSDEAGAGIVIERMDDA